jgi:hypothetical protein
VAAVGAQAALQPAAELGPQSRFAEEALLPAEREGDLPAGLRADPAADLHIVVGTGEALALLLQRYPFGVHPLRVQQGQVGHHVGTGVAADEHR